MDFDWEIDMGFDRIARISIDTPKKHLLFSFNREKKGKKRKEAHQRQQHLLRVGGGKNKKT
ncbi:hypothetical protein QJS04_geneDACA003947 [Acorus gramineus]|uniref:Uncharacterized protein n=1 Tax=Acorus gramineus TaxID=55184 RepID=A0AAV9BGL1_ACOGR|nr:hypothetical protein QJS04_geneDACA003947 [Acorus gramineus]